MYDLADVGKTKPIQSQYKANQTQFMVSKVEPLVVSKVEPPVGGVNYSGVFSSVVYQSAC